MTSTSKMVLFFIGATVFNLLLMAVLVVGFVVFYRQHQSNLRAEQAAESLARATDVASLERVIGSFPGSQSAAEALSRLADLYYRNGRYADAASTYQRIEKEFSGHPLAESAKLDFRAEWYNVTNHTQFAVASTAVGNASFGQVTSNGSANRKAAQFSARIEF